MRRPRLLADGQDVAPPSAEPDQAVERSAYHADAFWALNDPECPVWPEDEHRGCQADPQRQPSLPANDRLALRGAAGDAANGFLIFGELSATR